jgi:hypothetical protein
MVWSRLGLITPAPPSVLRSKANMSLLAGRIPPGQVCPKYNLPCTVEITLCETKPQTSLVFKLLFPKCVFVKSQLLFFSLTTIKKRPTTKNLRQMR